MHEHNPEEITRLLLAWRTGDADALGELMPRVYRELKLIAGRLMRRERKDHTLVSTALVHETYLRLGGMQHVPLHDRSHFYAMCARIMRRVLVDHARALLREKRGGNAQRVGTSELLKLDNRRSPDLIALDDALVALAEHDAEMAHIVELRFFGGLDRDAIAEVTGLSSATVTRRWRLARARLIHELG